MYIYIFFLFMEPCLGLEVMMYTTYTVNLGPYRVLRDGLDDFAALL
jgi:hypothetical protein